MKLRYKGNLKKITEIFLENIFVHYSILILSEDSPAWMGDLHRVLAHISRALNDVWESNVAFLADELGSWVLKEFLFLTSHLLGVILRLIGNVQVRLLQFFK